MSGVLNREDVRDEFRILFHDSISQECVALSRQVQMTLTQELWRVFDEFRKEIKEARLVSYRDAPVESPPLNRVSTPPVGPSSPCPLLDIQPMSVTKRPVSGTPHAVAPSHTGGTSLAGNRQWDSSFSTATTRDTAWPPLRNTAMGVAELPAHPTEGVKKITLQHPSEPDHTLVSTGSKPSLAVLDGITSEECTREFESEVQSGTPSMMSDYVPSSDFKSLRVGKRTSANGNGEHTPDVAGFKIHPAPEENNGHAHCKFDVPTQPYENGSFLEVPKQRAFGNSVISTGNDVKRRMGDSVHSNGVRESKRRNTYVSPYASQLEVLPGDELAAPDEMYEAWLPEKLRESFHPGITTINSGLGASWAPTMPDQRRRLRFSSITRISHCCAIVNMLCRGRVSAVSLASGFLQSEYFDYIMGTLVLLNAISIGVQVDFMARQTPAEVPISFRVIDGIFCVVFTMELICRFIIHKMDYFIMTGWQWNIFDLIVVSFQVIDECAKLFLTGTKVQETIDSLGVLRMLRLARILRLIRMVRLIPELRSMVYLLSASMWSFFWTAVLLLMLMFCVAVYFTEISTDLIKDAKVKDPEAVRYHYGSIGDSVRSLFQAITGGDDWREFVEPFQGGDSYIVNTFIFSFYVAFTMLVMLNLVTGVFVDGAQKIVQQDKDQELVRHVRKLFQLTDQDENGEISWAEFEAQLETEKMEAYLDTVEIGKNEARALFKLLDTDRSGEVNVEEFVLASLKLRGPAKSVDLNALKYDFEEITAMWGMRFITIDLNLRKLLDSMETIASTVSQDSLNQLRAVAGDMEQVLV